MENVFQHVWSVEETLKPYFSCEKELFDKEIRRASVPAAKRTQRITPLRRAESGMSILTEDLIFSKTGVKALSELRNLNLWGCELVNVSVLKKCTSLEKLSLSVNKLTTLEDLSECTKLTELYLRKNYISDITQVRHLTSLRKLQVLWLCENPCFEDEPSYRLLVLRYLPWLKKLDHQDVMDDEVLASMSITSADISSKSRRPGSVRPIKAVPLTRTSSSEQEDKSDDLLSHSPGTSITSLASSTGYPSPASRRSKSPLYGSPKADARSSLYVEPTTAPMLRSKSSSASTSRSHSSTDLTYDIASLRRAKSPSARVGSMALDYGSHRSQSSLRSGSRVSTYIEDKPQSPPSRQGSRTPSQQGSRTPSQQGSRTSSQQGSRTPSRQGSRTPSRQGSTTPDGGLRRAKSPASRSGSRLAEHASIRPHSPVERPGSRTPTSSLSVVGSLLARSPAMTPSPPPSLSGRAKTPISAEISEILSRPRPSLVTTLTPPNRTPSATPPPNFDLNSVFSNNGLKQQSNALTAIMALLDDLDEQELHTVQRKLRLLTLNKNGQSIRS